MSGVEQLSESLTLTHALGGYWLRDKTRGVNLAVAAQTRDAAFIDALTSYQRRVERVEAELHTLREQQRRIQRVLTGDDDE